MIKLFVPTVAVFLMIVANVFAQANVLQTVYQIQMTVFRDDKAKLNEISAFNSTVSAFPSSDTGYSIKILSHTGRTLFNEHLGISFILIVDPVGVIERNETTITVKVPYFSQAKSIAIYHSEKKILDIDLSKDLCNRNSICDIGENEANCPEDCKKAVSTGSSLYLYILVIASVFLVILILNYIRLKRKNSAFSSLKQKWS